MKQVWPQKVSKIVTELLNANACISIADNVTCGKLASVLTDVPNYRDYFCGSIVLGDHSGDRSLLEIRGPLDNISSAKLPPILRYMSDYCAHWFYVDKPMYTLLVYELDRNEETNAVTIAINFSYNGKSQLQKFNFNTDELTVSELRDTVIDHALEMLVESLTQYPHLKFMEL